MNLFKLQSYFIVVLLWCCNIRRSQQCEPTLSIMILLLFAQGNYPVSDSVCNASDGLLKMHSAVFRV